MYLRCCRLPSSAFGLFVRFSVLVLAAVLGAATALSAAAQATFTVTTLTDPAAGVASNCSNQAAGGSHDPSCSLRDALAAAAAVNGTSGTTAVTVNFASSLAASGNPGTITLGANALTLPTYTTVQGLTAGSGYTLSNLITIKGNSSVLFSATASVSNAALNNLILANGAPALSSGGTVTVSQCAFMQNSGSSGGAIVSSGMLTVLNSTFTGNSTQYYGGAIYSSGADVPAQVATTQNLIVSGSTFQGNSSATAGGAIYIGRDSVGSIDSSTFTANRSSGQGAAVFINNGSGLSRITNSILDGDTGGNECDGVGCDGAVEAFVFAGSEPAGVSQSGTITMTITLSSGQVVTVSGGYGPFSTGASLASLFGSYITSGYSSVLSAQGFGSTLEVAAQFGTITSVVFTNPAFFTITPLSNAVVLGTGNTIGLSTAAANLSPLGNYGGPTQTVLPLPGSAALCAITPAAATGKDQRGLPRTTAFGGILCQDSGSVQTNYGLTFVQQPGSANVNAVLAPAPSVQVTESGQNLMQSNGLVTVKDAGSSLSGTTSTATQANGIASFSSLVVTKAQAADTLTAALTVAGNTVSVTSNPFSVAAQPTATLAGNATFPATALNGSSSQVFTFTNTGVSSIAITTLSVASAPEFTQTNTCGLVVAAGASCAISITFNPVATGTRSGTLTLVSSGSGYASTVALTGIGVLVPSFTLADNTSGASSTNISIAAGGTGTGTLRLTSVNAFAGSVSLTCAAQGTAPAGVSCTVTSPVTLAAGGTATATVTLTTTSRAQSAGFSSEPLRVLPAFVFLAGLLSMTLPGFRSSGRLMRGGSLLMLLFAFVFCLAGCGRGGSAITANPNGTPAGTYSYTVSAAGGGSTAAQTIAVTVQ